MPMKIHSESYLNPRLTLQQLKKKNEKKWKNCVYLGFIALILSERKRNFKVYLTNLLW